MLIKLTEQQKTELQKYLMPEFACNLKTGAELETDEFWDLDWYFIIPSENGEGLIKTTCEIDYPVSVQVYYMVQWWEIDVISEKLTRRILNQMFI